MKNVGSRLKKLMFCTCLFLSLFLCLYPSSFFEEGMELLIKNDAEGAVSLFLKAVRQKDCPQNVYLYLGIAYLKLGEYNDAINTFAKGKNKDQDNFYVYSFNMGNAFFAQNRYYDAEVSYSEAISTGKVYPPAVLNRANARMKIAKYLLALSDYKEYLVLSPNDEQEDEIKKMISLLEKIKLEEEKEKAILLEEAARLAGDAIKKAEEERQKKILEDINSSLSSVKETNSVSSGTEETIDYEEENELD